MLGLQLGLSIYSGSSPCTELWVVTQPTNLSKDCTPQPHTDPKFGLQISWITGTCHFSWLLQENFAEGTILQHKFVLRIGSKKVCKDMNITELDFSSVFIVDFEQVFPCCVWIKRKLIGNNNSRHDIQQLSKRNFEINQNLTM